MNNRDATFFLIVGLCAGALVFLLLAQFGKIEFSVVEMKIDLAGWVTALGTLALAMLTFFYLLLTRKILLAQNAPYVIVTAQTDVDRPTIINIVVRNVGNGLAKNVSFKIPEPIPDRVFGMEAKGFKNSGFIDGGPLVTGIPALGPNEERVITWGQYPALLSKLENRKLPIKSSFQSAYGKKYTIESFLDIYSFLGTSDLASPLSKIAKELTDSNRTLNQFSTGSKEIHVKVIGLPDDTKSKDE